MTQFAYYQTPDNTIAEMELSREDMTTEAIWSNRRQAIEFADFFGFTLIGIWHRPWDDSKWEHEYARLERYGYFTAERAAELFDSGPVINAARDEFMATHYAADDDDEND